MPQSGNGNGTPPGATFPAKNVNVLHKDEPEVALPAKLTKINGVQNISSVAVCINGFNVSLKDALPVVFQHELKFIAIDNKGKEKDLSRGPRNDVANILRHEALFDCFLLMLDTYKADFGVTHPDDCLRYVYDCGINFYSAKKLMDLNEEKKFELDVTRLSEKSLNYFGHRYQRIEGVLLATEEINLKSTSAISTDLSARNRSVIQFLEILSSQFLYNKRSYYVFRQKMFEKDSRIPIQNDPRVIKSGMQKNVRFVGDSLDTAHPLLQIDPKKSAFYDDQDLLKFIMDTYRVNERDFGRLSEPRLQRQMARDLKGIVVNTKHLAKNTFFTIHGLTENGADRIFFEGRDGQQQTVRKYYEKKYNMRLRFPQLPCVIEKRVAKVDGANRTKESFYPFELLKIHDGQRIPRTKMTPALTEQMIRNCQLLPGNYARDVEIQRGNAFLNSGSPAFKAFGIKIDANIRLANAEILHPPSIQYANGVAELPGKDRFGNSDITWKVDRRRFVKGAQLRVWVACLFQRGIQPALCNEFVNALTNSAMQFGVQLPKPASYEEIDSSDIEKCRERMKFYKSKGVQFVMFFTREKMDPVHNTMKLLEVEFGIATQHVHSKTIQKATGDRGALLVLGNILQKLNLKLGGINQDLVASQQFKQKNHLHDDIVGKQWLGANKMFIGIDLSHAAPQNLFERQAGVPSSEPTIVGMAYTIGKSTDFRGTYWCQQPRLTIVEHLSEKVATAMENYQANNGTFPSHLVVYRSGMSDGEYAKLATEADEFKEAFEVLSVKNPEFQKPYLTIIIINRASNYRVVPKIIDSRAKPPDQNCPSGTVLDKEVMHPTQTEFLLVAQKAIQGTAQPIRCTLAYSDAKPALSLEEIEGMTYALCFGHSIVSSPVSVPAVLYSAADLAKRGRNNWKEWNFGGAETESVMSGGSGGGRFKNTGEATYFTDLSENIKPIINTKFWA